MLTLRELEKELTDLQTRIKYLMRGVLLAIVVSILSAGAATKGSKLASSVARSATHNVQAGNAQRVTTISQRCDLTAKIKSVLERDDPQRVAAFDKSYAECEMGLRQAEKLVPKNARLQHPNN